MVFGLTLFRTSLSLYLSNISCVDILVCLYQRISGVQARTIPEDVRSPSSRRFCIPSVSSITGPFTKLPAPNVTNKAINSTIDTLTTAWRILLSNSARLLGKLLPRRTRSIRLPTLLACCLSFQIPPAPLLPGSRRFPE